VSDLLIVQSVSADAEWQAYLDRQRPFHEAYAWACGADYQTFVGVKERGVGAAWNRLPMFLDAFERGYERVLWMDADTLVVRPEVDVFAMTPNARPWVLPMSHGMPWPGLRDAYNDGVWMVRNTPESVRGIQWVWAQRSVAHRPHHTPGMWELNWVLDYIAANDEDSLVERLDDRFNWRPWIGLPPREEAIIMAWHGMGHAQRWPEFCDELSKLRKREMDRERRVR